MFDMYTNLRLDLSKASPPGGAGVARKQTSMKIYLSSLYVLYKGLLLFSVYATIVSLDTIRDAFREYIYTVD